MPHDSITRPSPVLFQAPAPFTARASATRVPHAAADRPAPASYVNNIASGPTNSGAPRMPVPRAYVVEMQPLPATGPTRLDLMAPIQNLAQLRTDIANADRWPLALLSTLGMIGATTVMEFLFIQKYLDDKDAASATDSASTLHAVTKDLQALKWQAAIAGTVMVGFILGGVALQYSRRQKLKAFFAPELGEARALSANLREAQRRKLIVHDQALVTEALIKAADHVPSRLGWTPGRDIGMVALAPLFTVGFVAVEACVIGAACLCLLAAGSGGGGGGGCDTDCCGPTFCGPHLGSGCGSCSDGSKDAILAARGNIETPTWGRLPELSLPQTDAQHRV